MTKNEGEDNVAVCVRCAVHLFVLTRDSRYETGMKVKLQT
jgi:hypothetical protein